jgi:hypothetical protein
VLRRGAGRATSPATTQRQREEAGGRTYGLRKRRGEDMERRGGARAERGLRTSSRRGEEGAQAHCGGCI